MPFPTGVLFYEHIKHENHRHPSFTQKNQANSHKKERSDKKQKNISI